MKIRNLLPAATIGLSALSGWAQGLVDFRNAGPNFSTVADRRVYAGTSLLVGTNYVAGLWYVAGSGNGAQLTGTGGNQAFNANPAHPSLFPFRIPTTAVPGTWNPGVNPFYFLLAGVSEGASATLQVRVWDRTRYATFQDAFYSGAYGVSFPFDYTAPTVGAPPSYYYMEGLRFPIPEPSTVTLGLLGVASVLALRRRRQDR